MVNYFIYAKDYSGSTDGVLYYHKNGLNTLEQFKSDVNKIVSEISDAEKSQIIYLHWGHECVQVDENIAVTAYEEQDGQGHNTLPETIIKWVKENIDNNDKIKLLYIITDGLIHTECANTCLELNKNIHYENVVFHAINQDLDCIDLSVTASFIKGHCTIYRNNEIFDDTDISKEFDYDNVTTDNFATEKDCLKSYIKFKFLNLSKNNATALTEIEKLKKLRNRLLKNLLSENDIVIDTTDKNTFLREFMNTYWYKSFSNPLSDLKVDIEKSITTLINYIVCDKKSFAFDNLKFVTTFSNEVPEEPIVDVNFTTDQEIEFPDIILDDEKGIPVILCTELNLLDKIIFQTSESTASFSKFNSIMECPLFLLNDPDFNESIGYFYTINVYRQLLEKTTKLEPRTRRPFHGGLVLVDTDDFDRYNDYILSATYFDFKKVKYNVGLFYFVLWKICEKKEWMDRNVVEQFKKYMLRRIITTKCKVGLSSLPLDPQINTSLPTALWYCVEMSSLLFKDDPDRFAHERLRMYYGIAHSMIEILKYLNYDLDLDLINKRRDLIRHVMILKKIPTRTEKVLYLVENIFKNVNGFLVSEIENPANVKKLNYLKLDHKKMLKDDIITEKVNLKDYVHFLYHTDVSGVEICEKTFRPFFMIDQNRSFYTELFKTAKQVVVSNVRGKIVLKYGAVYKLEFNKMLSFYKLFLHCVKDGNKFPTLNEYTEYILKKKKIWNELVTIFPVNVFKEIEKVFQDYETVIKDVSVSEFVAVSNKYATRFERIKAENKMTFASDDEIREFIYNEECKVNLKNVQPKPMKGNQRAPEPVQRMLLPVAKGQADAEGFIRVERKKKKKKPKMAAWHNQPMSTRGRRPRRPRRQLKTRTHW